MAGQLEFVVRLLEKDSDPEEVYRGDAEHVAEFVREWLVDPLHFEVSIVRLRCTAPVAPLVLEPCCTSQ
jgi:hypothetical protein